MAKAKGKGPRPAAKGRTTAKTAARNVGGGDEKAEGRPGRPSAKDAVAKAVSKPPEKAKERDKPVAAEAKPAAVAKKDGPRPKPAPTKRTTPSPSSRYTPPIPKSEKVSPIWVPILMFTCLIVGMLTIILNYVNVLPGPDPSNVYLMIGLGLITVGFITATKYH